MLDRLRNISLDPQNLNAQTIAAAVALYMVVIACTVWSIFERSNRRTRRSTQWVWCAVVVCVPILGLLAYLPYSIKEDVFPYLGFWRRF